MATKVLTVIPIIKGGFREKLSYFTTQNISEGALVLAPMGSKIIPALVLDTEDIKDIKSSLKQSDFSLKPIKTIVAPFFLTKDFVESCKEITEYFSSSLGSVIKDLVPPAILEEPSKSAKEFSPSPAGKERTNNRYEIIVTQAPDEERHQYYKSIIREEFAKNRSVFFCLPTASEIEKFSPDLKKGIEKYSVILHSNLSKKKMRDEWHRASSENHPLLIIATKSFLSIPRQDINTIIVDCENSPHYKLQRRPYLDVRKVAEIISKKTKARLIFGDLVLRSETFYRREAGETTVSQTTASRILSNAEQIIIDMKKQKGDWRQSKNFSIISEELKTLIESSHKCNEKIILLANRRGYSPTTVCNDCLRTILCEKCDSPLVLHKNDTMSNLEIRAPGESDSQGARISKLSPSVYICHKCLHSTPTFDKCPYCKSYRLETLGIGIQRATEEISKLFPKIKIFRLDSDMAKTGKQGQKIASDFLASPGSILIGTEALLSYIKQPVERTAVVSIDAAFTIPDFRNSERIFHTLLRLRALAKKTFLIQTRLAEQELFNEALRGNASGFYRQEIENRKTFQYPPFRLLMKITGESKNRIDLKNKILALEKYIGKIPDTQIINYPAFTPKIKNNYVWHILLKLDPKTWPHNQPRLKDLFSRFPPSWRLDVEPESLL